MSTADRGTGATAPMDTGDETVFSEMQTSGSVKKCAESTIVVYSAHPAHWAMRIASTQWITVP